MAESFKVCPICNASNHANAVVCSTCGAALSDVEPVTRRITTSKKQIDYDFRYGETDLLEPPANSGTRSYMVIGLTLLVGIGIGAIMLAAGASLLNSPDAAEVMEEPTSAPVESPMSLPTVTLGPPTATYTHTPGPTFTPSITPTPAPCTYTIPAGGALTWALTNCGYNTLDILPTVLALNGLQDAASVRAGQEIIVPWPTATEDPDAIDETSEEQGENPEDDSTENQSGSTNDGQTDEAVDAEVSLLQIDTSIDAFAPTATPTLPAGIMWHRVETGEYISTIIDRYNSDVKVLSELNPQVDFARCEFGARFGGPDCIVQLFPGQMLRVPAPTPTPTLSPTPNPNATATPTPTATFNVPLAQSPADRAVFLADQIVTLRWIPSATLKPGQAYRIDVEDLTAGITYTGYTSEIRFVIPAEWQGKDGARHNYEWTVGVIDQNNPETVEHRTMPRVFVWQAATEGDS